MSFAFPLVFAAAVELGGLNVNPLAWSTDGGVLRSLGYTKAMYLGEGPSGRHVRVSADVVPEKNLEAKSWSVMGLTVYEDDRNFWHLAFVKPPAGSGIAPSIELSESRDGKWNAQTSEGLKRTDGANGLNWRYGEKYTLTLELGANGVSGLAKDGKGQVVFERSFSFGGKPAVKTGRPGVRATSGFVGTFSSLDFTVEDPLEAAAKPVIRKYVAPANAGSRKLSKATGFFRLERQESGRWVVVDPAGVPTFMRGVDQVSYKGSRCEALKCHPMEGVNSRRYANKGEWESDTLKRLSDWGFNLYAGDPVLAGRGPAVNKLLFMGESLCWGVNDDYWICRHRGTPCSAFPNVFHPSFPAYCDYVARKSCAPLKDDPWLFGYFLDNELAWWGLSWSTQATGLFDEAMNRSEGHAARRAAEELCRSRGVDPKGRVPDAVKTEFLSMAAERYFSVAVAAVRRADPNHLVLGARFAGLGGAHDAVWKAAGRHCDIVSFNCYPWVDLDRNCVYANYTDHTPTRRVSDAFRERSELTGRPLLITEWAFIGLDSGLPCTGGAGQRFRTQAERTAAAELFARTMLASPEVIGYSYFMWYDEPALGISAAFPENSNYGLLDGKGDPYPGLTSMFARLHGDLDRYLFAALPEERQVAPQRPVLASAMDKCLPDRVEVRVERREDGVWTVSNGCGMTLEVQSSGRPMIRAVRLNGVELGSLGALLNFKRGKELIWADATRVEDVQVRKAEDRAVVLVRSVGDREGVRFALTFEFTVFPGRPVVLCDVVELENLGKRPIDVRSIYIRQQAPFVRDTVRVPMPSHQWKAPKRACWMAKDGRFFGAISYATTCRTLSYWLDGQKGAHPDAAFDPEKPVVLAPGAVYRPEGTMHLLSICGFGGAEAWNGIRNEMEELYEK